MPEKNFKDLLKNAQKLRFSEKILNAYEKHKSIRRAGVVGLGIFSTITFLLTYPGTFLPMQKPFKELSAKTHLEFHYLKAISLESYNSWIKVLSIGEYYLAVFRRDVTSTQRIEYPEFVSQCFDLLQVTLEKTKTEQIFFYMTLKSLGIYLFDIINLNPKLFRHTEVKDSLLRLMNCIRKNCEIEDRISSSMDNSEWTSLFNLFLIIAELGTAEKIAAYQDLNYIISRQRASLKLACDQNFMGKVFRDTVCEEKDVVRLALGTLLIVASEKCGQEFLVKNFLVFNLYTKVKEKNPEMAEDIRRIVKSLGENREVWRAEGMEKERKRLEELVKVEEDEVLRELVKSFNT